MPSSVRLPALTLEIFRTRLTPLLPPTTILTPAAWEALHIHYEQLRQWSPRLALIGPGTLPEVLERHFAESLAPLPHIPETPPASGHHLDVGSGAGFPGLVLAATRPAWTTTLVEAREKKWAFLETVIRKSGLSCRCLNARVGNPLPDGIPAAIDLLTARAIRLPVGDLASLLDRLSAAGRALFWSGNEDPQLPPGYGARTLLPLPGSERRRVVEVRRQPVRESRE